MLCAGEGASAAQGSATVSSSGEQSSSASSSASSTSSEGGRGGTLWQRPTLQPDAPASEDLSGFSWGFSAQQTLSKGRGAGAEAAQAASGGKSVGEPADGETRTETLYIQMEFCPRTLKVRETPAADTRV